MNKPVHDTQEARTYCCRHPVQCSWCVVQLISLLNLFLDHDAVQSAEAKCQGLEDEVGALSEDLKAKTQEAAANAGAADLQVSFRLTFLRIRERHCPRLPYES